MVTTERLRSLAISLRRAGMWYPRLTILSPCAWEGGGGRQCLNCACRIHKTLRVTPAMEASLTDPCVHRRKQNWVYYCNLQSTLRWNPHDARANSRPRAISRRAERRIDYRWDARTVRCCANYAKCCVNCGWSANRLSIAVRPQKTSTQTSDTTRRRYCGSLPKPNTVHLGPPNGRFQYGRLGGVRERSPSWLP